MNDKKTSQQSLIASNVIKMNNHILSNILSTEINNVFQFFWFPSWFKIVDVTLVSKKGSRSEQDNYRLVGILPNLSNVFERCLNKQMFPFFDDVFSK